MLQIVRTLMERIDFIEAISTVLLNDESKQSPVLYVYIGHFLEQSEEI